MSGLNHKPTQCGRILEHLEEHGTITNREMILHYGIGQPTARIFELRQRGIAIVTTMTEGRNRFNEPCRYAVYTIKKDGKGDEQEKEIHTQTV